MHLLVPGNAHYILCLGLKKEVVAELVEAPKEDMAGLDATAATLTSNSLCGRQQSP